MNAISMLFFSTKLCVTSPIFVLNPLILADRILIDDLAGLVRLLGGIIVVGVPCMMVDWAQLCGITSAGTVGIQIG